MGRSNAVRRAGRIARRLPGYRYARRTILPRMRGSSTARALVKRVFDVDAAQRAPLDVSAGHLLGGVGTERLPVVVVVMIDVPAGQVREVVDEVAELQLLTAGFRPVFVLDVPEFAAVRRYGYPVELLIDEASWARDDQTWQGYARARLAAVTSTFRSRATVTANRDGLDPTGRLLLSGLAPPVDDDEPDVPAARP